MLNLKEAAQFLGITVSTLQNWEELRKLILLEDNQYTQKQLESLLLKYKSEKFIQEVKEKYGEDINFDKMEYANLTTKITITCPKHGDFSITPHYLLYRGFFCVQCNNDKKNELLKNEHIGQMIGTKKIIDFYGMKPPGQRLWKAECQNCNNITISTMYEIRSHILCKTCKGRPKGETGALFRFVECKRTARQRKLDFDLTLEEFKLITSQNCHYCGVEPKPTTGVTLEWSQYLCNGIDRVDNNKGYIFENCVPCCKICNSAKLDKTYDEFIIYIKKITTLHKARRQDDY